MSSSVLIWNKELMIVRLSIQVKGMMVMAQGKAFLNNKVWYRSMVSKNEIT